MKDCIIVSVKQVGICKGELKMAQGEPVWELHKEADDMVAALIIKFPDVLGHIGSETIGCAAIAGKDKPEGQTWDAQIEGIKEPPALWSKKIYCIKFYKTTWDSYTDEQRQFMLFRMLERIADECNGKVLPYSLQDSYRLIKYFGVEYMKDVKLPNLLRDGYNFGPGKDHEEE
jgi:hypothetical protein